MSQVKAGAAYVELFVKGGKFSAGMEAASAKLRSFGRGATMVGGLATAAGTAIVTPFLAAAKSFAAAGDAVHKMASRTGISTKALSELGFAAEQSGSDLQTLEGGIRGMQRTLLNASEGSKAAVDGLAALGLTFQDLEGMNPEDQFKAIADRIADVQDPSKRAALAMRIFGRAGQQLVPLLAEGADGIAALQAEADRLGLSIDAEAAQDAAELTDAWNRLKRTLMGTAVTLGSAVAPAITEVVNAVAAAIAQAIAWIKQNKTLAATIFAVGTAVAVAGVVLTAFGGVVAGVGIAISGIVTAIGAIGAVVAAIASPIGIVVALVLAAAAALIYFSGIGGQVWNYLKQVFASIKADAVDAFGGIAAALRSGDIKSAALIAGAFLYLQFLKASAQIKAAFRGAMSAVADMAWSAVDQAKLAWVKLVAEAKVAALAIRKAMDPTVDVFAEASKISAEAVKASAQINKDAANRRQSANAKNSAAAAVDAAAIAASRAAMEALIANAKSNQPAGGDGSTNDNGIPNFEPDEFDFDIPSMEIPEPALPTLELADVDRMAIDGFGEDFAGELDTEKLADTIGGFDTAGIGFGGSARLLTPAAALLPQVQAGIGAVGSSVSSPSAIAVGVGEKAGGDAIERVASSAAELVTLARTGGVVFS
ncbi:MAG: phage tail tape measure protein [Planctomycetota bacterium]